MNTKLIGCLSILLCTLSACATSATPDPTASSVTTMSKAQRYQAAVQTQAKLKGVDVHWVNLPDEGDLARYKDPKETETPANGPY